MKKWIILIGLMSATLAACSPGETSNEKQKDATEHTKHEATTEGSVARSKGFYQTTTNPHVDHLHGLGYPGSSDMLMLATHGGPLLYDNGEWKETSSEKHDYMGFQAVSDGFVSSGHPEPGTDYKNPLGLLKSTNLGETFKQYAFAGEIDFHYLGASYNTDRIYVYNQMPTKKLGNGFYYTDDLGNSWSQMKMGGFDAKMMSNIAAHPDTSEVVAIGTDQGVYLSTDSGDTFTLIHEGVSISSVTLSATHAFAAAVDGDKVQFLQIDLSSKNVETLSLPELTADNAITLIALHPTNVKELSFATLQNDVYQTIDGGTTWVQLINAGKVTKK